MSRFVVNENVVVARDLDADETGTLPVEPVTAKLFGLDGAELESVTATGNGTVYTGAFESHPVGTYAVEFVDADTRAWTFNVEVVGSHICTVADIRAGDSEFSDANRFPAVKLRAGREYVLDEFEQITERAFVRRSVPLYGVTDGTGFMLTGLRDSPVIKSLKVNGVDAELDAYDIDDNGILEGDAFDTAGNSVAAVIEHGFKTVPEDVKRVAGIRVRSVVSQAASGLPDRATSIVSPDGGQINLATAGRAGYETGIPEVDAVLSRYTYRLERDLLGMM